VYRAVDQHGQVTDILVSKRRDSDAARRFFRCALTTPKVTPTEVVTDAAPVYPESSTSSYRQPGTTLSGTPTSGSKPTTALLKHRLRPMRGLRTDRTPPSSSPDSRSRRIFVATTTNSPPKPHANSEPLPGSAGLWI
jgi:IS6 family transposase